MNDPILSLSKKKRLISEAEKAATIEVISQPIVLNVKVKNYYARHDYVKRKLCERWQQTTKEGTETNIKAQVEAFNDYMEFIKMTRRLIEKRYHKAWQAV